MNLSAAQAGYTAELLRDRGQPVYAVLSSLIGGHLGGLFDGPSTVRFDPDAPMIALGSAALGEDDLLQSLVMLCASAWVGSPWPTLGTGSGSSSTTGPGESSPAKRSWTG